MKLKDNSTQEIDTALYQLEQRLKSNIRLTDVENSNASTAKINAVDKKLTEEVKDRQSADGKLQDNINKEIADRKEADAAIENAKQDKLIAGNNIQIDGNVISATSTEYTAEAPVKVTDGKISLDTVPVTKGGTGVTTQADINKAFIGNLEIGNSDVTDGTEFVSSWASDNGFAETADGALNKPYKRQFVKVWNYIKGKISSVLGLTKDTYGGKASTSEIADKTVNDITLNIPFVTEGGQYVIPLGNILEPTSTATGSPYNWDITGFFSIIRPSGHNGSHLWFEAGHGFSHDWTTYAYLDKLEFGIVSTTIKAFQYDGKWWLGLCIITGHEGYVDKMTITYSRGLPATPTCILYNSKSDGVANEEIYNSIQDIPSSWWRVRAIYNPTYFSQNITAPNIASLEQRVTALESKLLKGE